MLLLPLPMPIDLEKVVSEMLLPMLPLSKRFALNEKEGRKKVKEHWREQEGA